MTRRLKYLEKKLNYALHMESGGAIGIPFLSKEQRNQLKENDVLRKEARQESLKAMPSKPKLEVKDKDPKN